MQQPCGLSTFKRRLAAAASCQAPFPALSTAGKPHVYALAAAVCSPLAPPPLPWLQGRPRWVCQGGRWAGIKV